MKVKPRRKKKNLGGRPVTTGIGIPIMLRVHKPLITKLDRWRRQQGKPLISRPEAIRRLATQALA